MARFKSLGFLLYQVLLLWPLLAHGMPRPQTQSPHMAAGASSYWLAQIQRQGTIGYGSDASYKIFRNVKDYGAVGDGTTDDTSAINRAIADQNRCGQGCDSSTVTPAIVYFPPGQYAISAPVVMHYYTQLVGDALSVPTIVALSSFQGLAMLDSDPYIPNGWGAQWFTNQNNFFRQVRNFIVDMTRLPETSESAGIHWQVAQATSLQNIIFNMLPKSSANKQKGIFMENGSGGFMTDLVFNGGDIGALLGNQQFTTRNLKFNGCNTAVKMSWNWLWTFKSLAIDGCSVGVDMASYDGDTNQSVGSIILLDSSIKNTEIGIKTAFSSSSVPKASGTLTVQNVDFTGTMTAIGGVDNSNVILAGGSKVGLFIQGDAYFPVGQPARVKRSPQVESASGSCNQPVSTATVTVRPLPATNPTTTSTSTIIMTSSTTVTPTSTLVMSSSSAVANSTSDVTSFTATNTSSTAEATVATSASSTLSMPLNSQCTISPAALQSSRLQQPVTAPSMPASLMNNDVVFERSKPQYENVGLSSFVSVKSAGAKGDGVTDDSDAIQRIFDTVTTDQMVYFDHGAYVITRTINVPKNIRITGEIWPLIMISGTFFSDVNNPQVAFRVGNPGDTGNVEISDIIFETVGPAAGAIMMEWNIAEASQGSCGMWDVHFRVGGSTGTELQQEQCLARVAGSQTFKPECAGSFLMMHITQTATAYLENCWFWVADHDLDSPMHNQTNIYSGRGLLVESQGPVWLWGTSSEHHQLYNYQVANAKGIFMGAIQTETAYMQAAPNALDGGFPPNPAYSDPDFADCTTNSCKKTWGLRVVDSSEVLVYGAGLYSFFENYDQTCLDTESCQENMVGIQCSTDIVLYGLTTKASTNMIKVNGEVAAAQADHRGRFGSTLAMFRLL